MRGARSRRRTQGAITAAATRQRSPTGKVGGVTGLHRQVAVGSHRPLGSDRPLGSRLPVGSRRRKGGHRRKGVT
eukprot:11194898-Lingulodinium_polyedra.AAC.1